MHVEKNVGESLTGTVLNVHGKTKDGYKARLDLVHYGLKPELHPQIEGNNTTLPAAGCTLTKEEKDKFCETLYNLRVPQGYCSNFSSLVSLKDKKLIGLKSHDYHMLMQQFLPISIRSIMHPPTGVAITRFCFFFKSICSKEIIVDELDKLQEELCVTLCLLEKHFPPSFFDVMIHLTVHLTREVKLCGPIFFRWMYPFERYMKVIKGHMRNKNRPEGCIAEENVVEETIEFFSQFLKRMDIVGIAPDNHNNCGIHKGVDSSSITDDTPVSAAKSIEVFSELFSKAHFFVLQNTSEVLPYIERHMEFLEHIHPTKRKEERELGACRETITETMRWISHGPNKNIIKYDVYAINGYTFHTKAHEGKVYQNSGVNVVATGTHISKEVVTYAKNTYYGVLQEIWVLDYHFKRIAIFMCDWVDNRKGVKRDKLGYTLVELKILGHKGDPFILASQAQQTPPKNYKDTYEDVDEEFSTIVPHNDNILPHVDTLDLQKENDYFRNDCHEGKAKT
ncbi:uncharacterized protein LOC128134120 [Lactuca sativa]|uniref:uncharacterized protein LOC128134120 n=1 Tax=Lactuca sativa TaxID=4236 RepID=UPI0022B06B91|nr:uncharacterized protein LOC128134120 [Lactuca sativa]